jgi:DNA processing protein
MLPPMDETRACALLARTPGLTADHVRALAAGSGSCAEALARIPAGPATKLPPAAQVYLSNPASAEIEADLRWLDISGAHLISCVSPAYPALLATIPDAPPALYVLGDVEALSAPQLAMVGSRNPTAGGRSIARDFATFFARSGLVITSGLALGIDAASHEGALGADGLTIAVCGCGLDQTYPPQHAGLAARIRERGALVSEFPPRTPPLRSLFPQRNRIISGLSLGTLVVEAALRSGSLITARLATEQGREVFAIPGSIHNPMARGCHKLIRDGAKLVESGVDVLCDLQFNLREQPLEAPVEGPAKNASTGSALDKEYEMLLDALAFEPSSIDALAERSGLPGESIASMLLILELEGRIAPHPGGRYGRVHS